MESQVHTYDNIFQTVHFKYVQFIIWQLYLTKGVKIMQREYRENWDRKCLETKKAT